MQLDRPLAAEAAFYQWRAHHIQEFGSVGAREKFGVKVVGYRRMLNGSYYKEKTEYCDEMTEGQKSFVELSNRL